MFFVFVFYSVTYWLRGSGYVLGVSYMKDEMASGERNLCVCVCLSRVTCEGDACHRRPCSPRPRLSACCFWWQPDWLMIRIYHLDLWRACPVLLAARMQVCCVFELATSSDGYSGLLGSHKNLHVCVKRREVDTRLFKGLHKWKSEEWKAFEWRHLYNIWLG